MGQVTGSAPPASLYGALSSDDRASAVTQTLECMTALARSRLAAVLEGAAARDDCRRENSRDIAVEWESMYI